jgi:hypothetical protein
MSFNGKVGSSTSQRTTLPSFATNQTVANEVNVRFVYAFCSISATVTVDAFISAEVETGIATNVFEEVWKEKVGLGITTNFNRGIFFAVEGGRRYRFQRSNGVGVTENLLGYSFTDT